MKREKSKLYLLKDEYEEFMRIYPLLNEAFNNRLVIVGSVANTLSLDDKIPVYKKYNTLLHDLNLLVLPAKNDSDSYIDLQKLNKIMNISYIFDTVKTGEYTPENTSKYYYSGYSKGVFNLPINIFMHRVNFDLNDLRQVNHNNLSFTLVPAEVEIMMFYWSFINRSHGKYRVAFDEGYLYARNKLRHDQGLYKKSETYWQKYGKKNAVNMIKKHESWSSKFESFENTSFIEFLHTVDEIYKKNNFDWMKNKGLASCIDTAHIEEIDAESRCNILDQANPKYLINFSQDIITDSKTIKDIIEKRNTLSKQLKAYY